MNILPREKQERAIAALCEGSSIRSVERMTGIHRDTIMRLGVRIGTGCANLMKATMKNLSVTHVELDEMWGFVGKKQHNFDKGIRHPEQGDFWVWCGIDRTTKLVPCFHVGKRTKEDARVFVSDLAQRVSGRIQISTDGLSTYVDAVERAFANEVDYGQIVKTFESDPIGPGRYSPPRVVSVEGTSIVGNPVGITTSHCEKLNHTARMHNRRLTRLTNAFSKRLENFKASVGLFYAYYNFVKINGAIRMTPALKAGVTSHLWTLGELMDEADAHVG